MLYPRACHLPAQCTYLDVLLLAHYRHPLRYLKILDLPKWIEEVVSWGESHRQKEYNHRSANP